MAVRSTRRAEPAAARQGRRAVVDIGSNSIRLVVFERLARAPLLLFNEKVLCGLGRGLDEAGRLNEAGVESAMVNLVRFVRLAKANGPPATLRTTQGPRRQGGSTQWLTRAPTT